MEIIVVGLLLGGPMAIVMVWSLRFRTAVVLAALIVILMRLLAFSMTEQDVRAVSERPLYRAGEAIESLAEAQAPGDPELQDSFLYETLPAAIGEVFAAVIAAVLLGFLYWIPSAVRKRIRGARHGLNPSKDA